MAVADVMDGEVVRRWLYLAADALGLTREAIDRLNVFPVPDADTGTNLHATIACAAAALAELPPDARQAEVWQAAASAALRGACGNSGIIVSQLLRGLADTCACAVPCDGQVVATALGHAAALARAAVRRPVEGTVLTVADAAAHAAAQAAGLGEVGLGEVGRAVALGARQALLRTSAQLDALAASGVVDAGGAGLCVLLDALSAAIDDVRPAGYEVPAASGWSARRPEAGPPAAWTASAPGARASALPNPYEVTFLIDATAAAVAELSDRLDELGDSLVVSGDGSQWHVHVHVADAGAVIEVGLAAGRPSKIKITFLNELPQAPPSANPMPPPENDLPQLAKPPAPESRRQDEPPQVAQPPAPESRRQDELGQVVAVVDGAGLDQLLAAAGALVVGLGPGSDPAAELGLLAGLPVRRTLIAVAELARCWPAGWPVVEVGSVIQAIAAVAVHDPGRDPDADAAAMRRAVAGMRWAAAGHPRRAGGDQLAAAVAVARQLIRAGTELITVVTGQAAEPGLADGLAAHLAAVTPDVEVVCYDGGMTSAALLIGAE